MSIIKKTFIKPSFDAYSGFLALERANAKPRILSGQEVITSAEDIQKQYEADLSAVPSFGEYVNAAERKQEEIDKLSEKFKSDMADVVNTAQVDAEKVKAQIQKAKFPLLTAGDIAERNLAAVEANTAVLLVNKLSPNEYPTAQFNDAIEQRRIDFASTLADNSLYRKTNGTVESVHARNTFQQAVKTFEDASGVSALRVSKLSLEIAVTAVQRMLEWRFITNAGDKILFGIQSATIQSNYQKAMNEALPLALQNDVEDQTATRQ